MSAVENTSCLGQKASEYCTAPALIAARRRFVLTPKVFRCESVSLQSNGFLSNHTESDLRSRGRDCPKKSTTESVITLWSESSR